MARKQGGRAVPLVVIGRRSGAALFYRQPWLGVAECLLALFVDAEDESMRRWIVDSVRWPGHTR
jgi:hypothetical protein